MISLTDVLQITSPADYKLHLACRNQEMIEPLDEYVASRKSWIGWNEWRGKKNDWNRARILPFIDFYPRADTWIFGGAFEVTERHADRYSLRQIPEFGKYVGRLLASFHRYQGMRGRAFRLESFVNSFEV